MTIVLKTEKKIFFFTQCRTVNCSVRNGVHMYKTPNWKGQVFLHQSDCFFVPHWQVSMARWLARCLTSSSKLVLSIQIVGSEGICYKKCRQSAQLIVKSQLSVDRVCSLSGSQNTQGMSVCTFSLVFLFLLVVRKQIFFQMKYPLHIHPVFSVKGLKCKNSLKTLRSV